MNDKPISAASQLEVAVRATKALPAEEIATILKNGLGEPAYSNLVQFIKSKSKTPGGWGERSIPIER